MKRPANPTETDSNKKQRIEADVQAQDIDESNGYETHQEFLKALDEKMFSMKNKLKYYKDAAVELDIGIYNISEKLEDISTKVMNYCRKERNVPIKTDFSLLTQKSNEKNNRVDESTTHHITVKSIDEEDVGDQNNKTENNKGGDTGDDDPSKGTETVKADKDGDQNDSKVNITDETQKKLNTVKVNEESPQEITNTNYNDMVENNTDNNNSGNFAEYISKLRLKYNGPGPGLVELSQGVWIDADAFEKCKSEANNCTSFLKMIYSEVLTENDAQHPAMLASDINIILDFVREYSTEKGWKFGYEGQD